MSINQIHFVFRHEDTKFSGLFVLKNDLSYSYTPYPSPYLNGITPPSHNSIGPVVTYHPNKAVSSLCYSLHSIDDGYDFDKAESTIFYFDQTGASKAPVKIAGVSCGDRSSTQFNEEYSVFRSKTGYVVSSPNGIIFRKDNLPEFKGYHHNVSNFIKTSANEFAYLKKGAPENQHDLFLAKEKIVRDGCEYAAKPKK